MSVKIADMDIGGLCLTPNRSTIQYSATEKQRARVSVWRVLDELPMMNQAACWRSCFWSELLLQSMNTKRYSQVYSGRCSCPICFPSNKTLSSVEAETLCKWVTLETVSTCCEWEKQLWLIRSLMSIIACLDDLSRLRLRHPRMCLSEEYLKNLWTDCYEIFWKDGE